MIYSNFYLPFVSIWINFWSGNRWSHWQAADIQLSLGVGDEGQIIFAGAAKNLLDLANLVQVMFARKHRLIVDHFSENTANTPDIKCLGVTLSRNK